MCFSSGIISAGRRITGRCYRWTRRDRRGEYRVYLCYYNQHWQYNALNQLTEIDTSSQSAGYPVGTNSAAVQADAANLTDNITQKLVKDCF